MRLRRWVCEKKVKVRQTESAQTLPIILVHQFRKDEAKSNKKNWIVYERARASELAHD